MELNCQNRETEVLELLSQGPLTSEQLMELGIKERTLRRVTKHFDELKFIEMKPKSTGKVGNPVYIISITERGQKCLKDMNSRIKELLLDETRIAQFFRLIGQATQQKKVDIPSNSRFGDSQIHNAVTENIDVEAMLEDDPIARPRHKILMVFKPDSTLLKDSLLLKQRKLSFREKIVRLLHTPLLHPRRLRGELFLTNTVKLGVHHHKDIGSYRLYVGVAIPTGTILSNKVLAKQQSNNEDCFQN